MRATQVILLLVMGHAICSSPVLVQEDEIRARRTDELTMITETPLLLFPWLVWILDTISWIPGTTEQPDICQLLEQYGWYRKITSLGVATLTDNKTAVEISLRAGCDVNYDGTGYAAGLGETGITALMLAVRAGSSLAVSILSRQQNLQLEMTDVHGVTALAMASDIGRLDIVKILVEAGANVSTTDISGRNPLEKAANEGHLATVQYLVTHGADTEQAGYHGITPLWSAAERGELEIVRYLASMGANLETTGFDGLHTITIAARAGRSDVVKFLIQKNVDVNARDKDGRTALYWARQRMTVWASWAEKYNEIAKLLEMNGGTI
eukprot:GFUD01096071.1.p1 GENE.GFUD01096071.1~~GFUD01096071.1.p1  ORF type:complete len:324 (+),score=73.62 GFUD01096071.1:13-984(+)